MTYLTDATCPTCGLLRAVPGEARLRLRLLPLMLTAVEAGADFSSMARCWYSSAEVCAAVRQRDAEERAAMEARR